MTDIKTALRNMIVDYDCGWWCDASDDAAVLRAIKDICENKEQQKLKGIIVNFLDGMKDKSEGNRLGL